MIEKISWKTDNELAPIASDTSRSSLSPEESLSMLDMLITNGENYLSDTKVLYSKLPSSELYSVLIVVENTIKDLQRIKDKIERFDLN